MTDLKNTQGFIFRDNTTQDIYAQKAKADEKDQNTKKRANELDGKTWTRYSISIWSDIKKTKEEISLGHPAIFPIALVVRLIQIFTSEDQEVVLDPFVGIGSTVVAAKMLGKKGIGFELNKDYFEKARSRCEQINLFDSDKKGKAILYNANVLDMIKYIEPNSIDLVITSPPYWDILKEKRTADYKEIRNYGDNKEDLGNIPDYYEFIKKLRLVFEKIFFLMKKNTYCCVIVMDIRKKNRFYPFHADVSNFMQNIGFSFDDIIIWDRRHEYNNMRPLGYPFVFRINKAHEFILIFKKE